MAQTRGLPATETPETSAEDKTDRRDQIEYPPTWGLLAPDDVHSDVSRGRDNDDEASPSLAVGWGARF